MPLSARLMARHFNAMVMRLHKPDFEFHGLGLSHHTWDQYIDLAQDYDVITYDLFGHGDSNSAATQT